MNNSNGAVQALNVGGTLTDHITVATADGTNQVVTITINGTNDAAIISGTTVGAVTEAGGVANGTPGTPTAIGTLTDTDVDNAANSFQAVAAGTATTDGYGTYAMKIGRAAWRERDNSKAAVQALNVGGTLTDHITVASEDGTTQVVTITINGTNDAAITSGSPIASVTGAGGVDMGTPGTPTAIGTLTDTDVDNAANSFQAVAAGTATTDGYGTYAMKIGRAAWRERDNSKAAVQALNVGGTLTDHITVASEDGTTQVVTITINGTNDAAITSGSPIASVTGAGGVDMGTPGTPTASGTLTDTDVDNAANSFQAVAAGTASTDGFGTYAMTAGGTWTYTLDNSNAAVQALNVGGTLTDHITVASEDGTTQVVTITINGANDAPVAVADVNAGNEDSLITGTVATNDSDVDSAALVYSLNAPVAGLTLNANGSYSLDASNAAYQQLAQGATLPVVANYTVTDDHGATSVSTLTITLSGVNDAPVITSNGGGATAALSVAENSTAVTTVTSSDVDTGATATYSIAGGADAALFTINSASGALAFLLAPNFESPTDAGSNNVYDVIVRVSD